MNLAVIIAISIAMLMIFIIQSVRIDRLKKTITEEAHREARETTRCIIENIMSDRDDKWTGRGLKPSTAQQMFKEFIIRCITEGIEGSEVIMAMIEKRDKKLNEIIEYWGSDEFVKDVVQKLNEYQLQ